MKTDLSLDLNPTLEQLQEGSTTFLSEAAKVSLSDNKKIREWTTAAERCCVKAGGGGGGGKNTKR